MSCLKYEIAQNALKTKIKIVKLNIMKTLKSITALVLTVMLTLTSCQDEVDNENGENPNTNNANSTAANNLKRTSMYDGSFDDFLDGVSCSSILLPVTATVNGTEINIVSQADYQQVISIIGAFNNDVDTIEFQFPLTVTLSNYTQVNIANQTEYNELIQACETLQAEAQDAIACVDIEFPITILTYDLNINQTGSVFLETEQALFTYINNLGNDELFAVNYPISVSVSGNSSVEISSDAELQLNINDCLGVEDMEDEAEENAEALETILVDGLFKVDSFINNSVDTANSYAEFTIDFANNLSIVAENTVNTTVQDVQGTYQVTSNTQVNLELQFAANANFVLLNNTWEVTSFSTTTITLQSTTNAAVTLVLTQV